VTGKAVVSRIAQALGLLLAVFLAMVVTVSAASMRWPSLLKSATGMALLNHTPMLAASLVLIALLTRGRVSDYGLTRGRFTFRPTLLLWALVGTVGSVAMIAFGGGGEGPAEGLTRMQTVALVWVYASVCEEVLYRGLLQSFLAPLSGIGIKMGAVTLSLPVLLCGALFGGSHLMLLTMGMDLRAVGVIVLCGVVLGCAAGTHRERTGSLLPAVLIHALFNIGGSLPLWIAQAFGT
jgi:membrane protease YdiL (CAAX protease family)